MMGKQRLRRIYALFVARNTEFFRDRAALSWSVALPVLIIVGFAFAFTNDNPEKFKVAYIEATGFNRASDILADLVAEREAVILQQLHDGQPRVVLVEGTHVETSRQSVRHAELARGQTVGLLEPHLPVARQQD